MEIWKFVLALVKEPRISHFIVRVGLGGLLILARDVLRPFGVIVGEDAAKALIAAGLLVIGGAMLPLFSRPPRR